MAPVRFHSLKRPFTSPLAADLMLLVEVELPRKEHLLLLLFVFCSAIKLFIISMLLGRGPGSRANSALARLSRAAVARAQVSELDAGSGEKLINSDGAAMMVSSILRRRPLARSALLLPWRSNVLSLLTQQAN